MSATAETKQSAYTFMLKLITGIFLSIDPIGDDEDDNPGQRLIHDVQLAAGPFMTHQHALTQLRSKCPPGKWRRKYNATMDLTASMEALYSADRPWSGRATFFVLSGHLGASA